MQHLARLRFERVAAQVLVFLLHFAEAGQDAIHVVRLRGIPHGMMQVRQLVVQIAELPAAGDGFIENGAPLHLLHVLAEVADGQLFRHRNVALVGGFFADDHAEQGRLARAVGTYQADLLPWVQLKRGVDKDQLFAVLLVDIGERDHSKYQVSKARRNGRQPIPRSPCRALLIGGGCHLNVGRRAVFRK